MNKTKKSNVPNNQRLTVNIAELAAILGTGKHTAQKVAEQAGAVIQLGRLKRYSISKIEAYLEDTAK